MTNHHTQCLQKTPHVTSQLPWVKEPRRGLTRSVRLLAWVPSHLSWGGSAPRPPTWLLAHFVSCCFWLQTTLSVWLLASGRPAHRSGKGESARMMGVVFSRQLITEVTSCHLRHRLLVRSKSQVLPTLREAMTLGRRARSWASLGGRLGVLSAQPQVSKQVAPRSRVEVD